MNSSQNSLAFGAPGMEPHWTSSAKEAIGTAYHTSCHLWFTLSHGIFNEIYYPHVDQPDTRDFQFLISDGETFCHEEKRDLHHIIEYPEKDCLFYRITNSEKNGRYRIIKHILADPHRSVLLFTTRVEVADKSLRNKLHLYALLAPHIARQGAGNSGWCLDIGGNSLLHASRKDVHMVMGCSSGFLHRSVGYVGVTDGWQDLMDNFRMDWEFSEALKGNIALTGEINLKDGDEFTIALAFGRSRESTVTKLLQSLAEPFDNHRKTYVNQWQHTVSDPEYDFKEHTSDGGHLFRLSRCILLAHEDKTFEGAMVASMSIPWGETNNDNDLGGYHLVWTRDLVQSATALLASGQTGTPLRALIWLAAIQRKNGMFPQNCWINGNAYWSGLQLDEIAAPILLAWRLLNKGADLGLFDPRTMIFRSAQYLILNGPITVQERWEENSGYSPSTLAMITAGLVCAAEFATKDGESNTADFILAYSDWLSAHLEEWTVTDQGELAEGIKRHYIRINPAIPGTQSPHSDPGKTMVSIANGGGNYPARNIVSGDFLQLVRLGLRAADDPLVKDSVKVIDHVLKQDLPQSPCWRRYNHDGYGQKEDGSAFDGTGTGRSWPILTGERGHYELAAGNDPMPYITAMEKFANAGGMITEQLWDSDDLPDGKMKRGCPTGAAMPLCWSHAEYLLLVRSRKDGVCFERVEPVFQRYVVNKTNSRLEIWSFRHPVTYMSVGRTLRIIVESDAVVTWSADGWTNFHTVGTKKEKLLNLWYADLPTEKLPVNGELSFTFSWEKTMRAGETHFSVTVCEQKGS
jgi:glucoamylase